MPTYKHWTEDYLQFDGYTNEWVAIDGMGFDIARALDKEEARAALLEYAATNDL